MVTVKVLYEYLAERDDELTLREGDIVENVLKADGGWWTGTLNGKTGVFPDNFVEEIAAKAKPPSKPPPPKAAAAPAPAPAAVAVPLPVAAPARPAGPKKKKAKCLFDYEPVQDDELPLKTGDIVTILKEDITDGWHEGEMHGKTGVFPSNFVELLADDHDEPVAGAAVSEPEKKPVQVHGVGFGNIFQGGMPTLKKTVPPPTAAKERPESTFIAPQLRQTIKRPTAGALVPPVPSSSKPSDSRPQYRVLFDYDASNEDELTLKVGQLLRLVKKEEGGWWQGDLDGKVGWFPDNFVEPAPEEEKNEKKEEPAPPPVEKKALQPPTKSVPPPGPPKPKVEEPAPPALPAKPKVEEPAPPALPAKPKETAAPPPLPAKKEAPAPAPEPAPAAAAPVIPIPRLGSTAKATPEVPAKAKPLPPPAKPKPVVKEDSEHKEEPAPPASAPVSAPAPAPAPFERTASNPIAQLRKVNAGVFEAAKDPAKDSAAPAPTPAAASASSAAADAKVAELSDLVKVMREEIDKLKKQVSMLTSELDDEKALRSKMQIDIDRIKKSLQ